MFVAEKIYETWKLQKRVGFRDNNLSYADLL